MKLGPFVDFTTGSVQLVVVEPDELRETGRFVGQGTASRDHIGRMVAVVFSLGVRKQEAMKVICRSGNVIR